MQISTTYALKAVSILVLAANVDAFWRMPCKGRTSLARIDPLVNFGAVADHVHAIHGSSGFSDTSTTDDLLAGDCTSCQVTQDKSAYWHPALYFKKANGEFQVVKQVGGMLAYYLLEPRDEKITAFPKGFEMLAGDTHQRNFTWPVPDVEKSHWNGEYNEQPFLSQWALGFNCLNYNANPEPALARHFLPDKAFMDAQCTEGIRLEIMFPSCWDGKNLAGVNNDKKSHMAYPALGNTGACPAGFPVRMITLFYESIWNTYEFKGQDGQFVFSNGDPTGYGYHADFIMGWDEALLQNAADTCKSESGRIEDCPLFNLQSESDMTTCTIPKKASFSAAFTEEVEEGLDSLPGNVEIKAGPAYAKGGKAVKDENPIPTTLVPSLEVSKIDPEATKNGYLPGQVFQETYPPSSSTPAPSAPEPTSAKAAAAAVINKIVEPEVTPAPQLPSPAETETANSQSFFKTETITKGREVVHVLWVEELVTVTGTVETVHTTSTQYINPGEQQARRRRGRHVHAHAQKRGH